MLIETRSHVEKKLLEYILLLRIISIPNPNALKTFIQQEYNLPIKFYNAILILKRAVSQHRDDVIYLSVSCVTRPCRLDKSKKCECTCCKTSATCGISKHVKLQFLLYKVFPSLTEIIGFQFLYIIDKYV